MSHHDRDHHKNNWQGGKGPDKQRPGANPHQNPGHQHPNRPEMPQNPGRNPHNPHKNPQGK